MEKVSNSPNYKKAINLRKNTLKLIENIKTKIIRVTSRNIEFYRELLGININDLSGKTILNLGSGNSKVDEELKGLGIDTNIFVNFDLKSKNGVIGDMRTLPFKDESFDEIITLWSIPWLNSNDKIIALSEALRTLKIGGKISIYPVSINKEIEQLLINIEEIEFQEPNIGKIKLGGKKSIIDVFKMFELYLVDLAHKGKESLKGKKTVYLKITKNDDYGKIIDLLKKLESKGIIF